MDPGSSTFLLLGPLTVLTVHTLLLRKVDIDHLAVPIIATSCVAYGLLVYIIQLGPATKLFASFWVSLWLWIGAYRASSIRYEITLALLQQSCPNGGL
jgi:hypothetical protein